MTVSDTVVLHRKLPSVLGGMTHEVPGPWAGSWVVGCEEERGLERRSQVDPVTSSLALSALGWGCW